MGDSAKSSFQRQITAITGLYQNYEKQERKVSELKSKLEELSKVRIETEEYKKLKDDIKALEDEFEKVETKQREWLDTGFSINSAPLQELDKQMDDIWADIDRLQRKQKEMQTTGSQTVRCMTAWFRNWVNMAYRLRKQRRFLSNMERKPECQVHLLKK